MFMRGPFMRFPFMDTGTVVGETRMSGAAVATGTFLTSTGWDATLEEADSPIGYFAVIEPHVLADRS